MIVTDVISPVTAATATIAVFLSLVYYFLKIRDILPGPRGLPYFGLYTYLKNDTCHLQLQEFGKKYGDIYSFTCLGKLIINLGSSKAIRELHVTKSDCFATRFNGFNIVAYTLEDGVLMSNGEAWKSTRKHFVQSFKEYGLTVMKDQTTGPLYDALEQTVEDVRARKGEYFNAIELLTLRCMGTMRKVIFGEDGVTDETLIKMNKAAAMLLEGAAGANTILFGPIAKFLCYTSPSLKRSVAGCRIISSMLLETIKKIESSMDENNPTCVVEDYIREKNKRKRKNDPSWKYFSDKALVSSLIQTLGDGITTVTYFIGCFLNALVEHPEEQEKIYKEVMDVVGPSRLPTIDDKSKLTYTVAFINEVIRTSNFFPLFPSMECTKETTVRGYRIPKGAITLFNFWQTHHDPETYENPYDFNPSRYISTPRKQRAELPVSFGIGKRSCIGEAYVMTQAFLFLTSLVKHFTISERPNPTRKSELFLMTGNLELRFQARSET